jgi:hypothetical protein
LEEFERTIEPLVPAEVSQEFKALVRRKIGDIPKEAEDLMGLDGEMNGYAQDMKDRIHVDGAPSAQGRR